MIISTLILIYDLVNISENRTIYYIPLQNNYINSLPIAPSKT